MHLDITSLNSGSNGNCYYVGNEQDAVLIDAGISCLETERRMARLGLSMKKIRAVFISHEHTDHISGLAVLAKKYSLPVFITPDTYRNSRLKCDKELAISFEAYEDICIGDLIITGFPKFHDAADPHSFVVESEGIKVGIFTDIGAPCEHLVHHFQQCHAAFLEANYDSEMLDRGRYPYFLKNRIRGGEGHLSNQQALDLFLEYKPEFMSHLILSHLSQANNSPQLVKELFTAHAGNTEIIVASRYQETPVYTIRNSEVPA